ncbi:MAG: phosphohydrolase [Flavobacteriales bacterium CG_4_9_14_3_um_filter_40_17]|nr:MAG: phosphohydrolase [Flavobacteriales bacterium CG_4_9_14_3_um_filter_40_17]
MKKSDKLKLFNDPIYGFISIQDTLIFELIEHPYFQRLRRITQMGLSYLVYPGAHHTRFHHALGCYYLMQKAIRLLRFKNIEISSEEEQALLIAILLHDIGHGPFSHAMESSIAEGVHHEDISLKFMEKLNREFSGKLTLAIQIFKKQHPKTFLCQLVSGQLDIDRMDYLKRDSFFTGVSEGNINSERIISMLNVHDNELVVEEKGIFSVEKFLMARRFMYWQVYLHKTSVAAELLLTNTLKRAKELVDKKQTINASKALSFFIQNYVSEENFDEKTIAVFSQIDDYDIIAALKDWQHHDDFVLSTLSRMLLNRKLFKIKVKDRPISDKAYHSQLANVTSDFKITEKEAAFFVVRGQMTNLAYNDKIQSIHIISKQKKIFDLINTPEKLIVSFLTEPVNKYYLCFPSYQTITEIS